MRRRHPDPIDDIPLAERRYSIAPPRQQGASGVVWKSAVVALFGLSAFLVLWAGPFRGLFDPSPVPGLKARLSSDGRLLGHFPYPEAKSAQLVNLSPGLQLRADAAESFLAMQRAAAADGVSLTVLSAFRSIETQRQLFFDVKADRNQSSIDRAKVSAPPGFSEHSTGYAIDVGDHSQPQTNLSRSFSDTQAYRWLLLNAARFHYALSFPQNNAQGVSFEPWHWRYEGSSESLRVFDPALRLQQAASPAGLRGTPGR